MRGGGASTVAKSTFKLRSGDNLDALIHERDKKEILPGEFMRNSFKDGGIWLGSG